MMTPTCSWPECGCGVEVDAIDEDGCPEGLYSIEAISEGWEAHTGFDSIATIERVYEQTGSGTYVCILPGCRFTRSDPAQLWVHVHSAHGEPTLPPEDFDPGPWL